jgi:hypothetical protein
MPWIARIEQFRVQGQSGAFERGLRGCYADRTFFGQRFALIRLDPRSAFFL